MTRVETPPRQATQPLPSEPPSTASERSARAALRWLARHGRGSSWRSQSGSGHGCCEPSCAWPCFRTTRRCTTRCPGSPSATSARTTTRSTRWFPYLDLGVPQFAQYQSLPSILTGLLSIPFGAGVFRWTNYLLICTWPISGVHRRPPARPRPLAGRRGRAVLAAAREHQGLRLRVAELRVGRQRHVVDAVGAVAHADRDGTRRGARSRAASGSRWPRSWSGSRARSTSSPDTSCCCRSACSCSCGPPTVPEASRPRRDRRARRRADLRVRVRADDRRPRLRQPRRVHTGTFWVNSYGPGKVFSLAVPRRGVRLRAGSRSIRLLVAVGAGRVHRGALVRDEVARVPLGLMVLSLRALLRAQRGRAGRSTTCPGGERPPAPPVHHRRALRGAARSAGIGARVGGPASSCVRRVRSLTVRRRRTGRRRASSVCSPCSSCSGRCCGIASSYADDEHVLGQRPGRLADRRRTARDVTALIDIAKHGTTVASTRVRRATGATQIKVDQVPLYQLPASTDADSLGFYLRTSGLSTDIEPYFDDSRPAQYDLFNVKYVAASVGPPDRRCPRQVIATRGDYTLYEVEHERVPRGGRHDRAGGGRPHQHGGGVLAVHLGARSARAAPRTHSSRSTGTPTPPPSSSASAPYTGPPGSASTGPTSRSTTAAFVGQVHGRRGRRG